MQKKYIVVDHLYYQSNTELLSYLNFLNSGNFCSIQFKPFWLPQLPLTGEQARSSTKKKQSQSYFVMLANKYGTTHTSASPK